MKALGLAALSDSPMNDEDFKNLKILECNSISFNNMEILETCKASGGGDSRCRSKSGRDSPKNGFGRVPEELIAKVRFGWI